MSVYVSQQFQAALKGSHTAVSTITAQRGGSSFTLDFTDGSITQSFDDASRWSMDLNFPLPATYTTEQMKNLLNQRLTTLRPARGVKFADGTSEIVTFAKFYITDVDLEEQVGGAPLVHVQAYDRSVRAQGDIASPFYIPDGTKPSDAIPQLIAKKIPGTVFSLANSQWPMPALMVTPEMDAWEESRRMLSTQGQNLYFDRDDRCISSIRSLVPNAIGIWHYNENASPDFWDVKRSGTNDLFPNVVVVLGTNSQAPDITGQAADMDPSSPTYRFGEYGEIVRTFRSEQVTTNDQANTMAAYLLSKLLGPQDEVVFNAVPNPMFDVGDTILMTRTSMGFNATPLLIVKIEMPLAITGAMTLTCRRSLLTDTSGAPVRP